MTDMESLNAGLGGNKPLRPASWQPTPRTIASLAEDEALDDDNTPPCLQLKKIPDFSPAVSTLIARRSRFYRPVLGSMDPNAEPSLQPDAVQAPAASAKPPPPPSARRPPVGAKPKAVVAAADAGEKDAQRAGSATTLSDAGAAALAAASAAAAGSAAPGGENVPPAAENAAGESALSVARAAEARMDEAMSAARRAMELARARRGAASQVPTFAPKSHHLLSRAPCALTRSGRLKCCVIEPRQEAD